MSELAWLLITYGCIIAGVLSPFTLTAEGNLQHIGFSLNFVRSLQLCLVLGAEILRIIHYCSLHFHHRDCGTSNSRSSSRCFVSLLLTAFNATAHCLLSYDACMIPMKLTALIPYILCIESSQLRNVFLSSHCTRSASSGHIILWQRSRKHCPILSTV